MDTPGTARGYLIHSHPVVQGRGFRGDSCDKVGVILTALWRLILLNSILGHDTSRWRLPQDGNLSQPSNFSFQLLCFR